MRRGVIDRRTTETQIALSIALDGKGTYQVRTGIRFLDHMLELFARHGAFDLKIQATGDLDVDQHHTVEDTGLAVGEAFVRGVQNAIEDRCPYIIFTAAGGARMQEGILSLMQMPRATVAIQMLHDEGLPYIVVLTDPTTGGVTASYAMLGDVQIAEPGALIGFAGQRVIEQTIREKLPEGFQRAEFLMEHGALDQIIDRRDMRDRLAGLLRLLQKRPPLAAA